MTEPNNRRAERWHVGKEIPIILIFGLVANAGGWIWFAATQTAQLNNLTMLMTDFKTEQYTQSDARRDMEINLSRSLNNARRLDEVIRRVEVLESRRKL